MSSVPARRPNPVRPGAVLAAAAVGLAMVQLDLFALNLALPRRAQDLDVQTTDLQWVISVVANRFRAPTPSAAT